MIISITGASGHIGNNLCRALIKEGHQIKVLINKSEKSLQNLNVHKIYGDILNSQVVDELIEGSDYVYHAAALITIGNEPIDKVFMVNTKGTKNIVDACLKYKIKRLVHFSSIHALHSSDPDEVLDEKKPLAGHNDFDYDRSKAVAENIVMDACKNGLDAIILNPSSVIGPFDFVPSLIGQMLIKIAKGKLPFLIKGGYHFVDVRDVVSSAINAMHSGNSGERYLLTSEWMSLMEIAEIISGLSNHQKPVRIPIFLAWIGLPFISLHSKIMKKQSLYTKESLSIIANSPKFVENKKAMKLLNFQPHPVSATFADAYLWFLNNNYLA